MKKRRTRHPLYPENVSRNSDLPIRDPEEDLTPQSYVSRTLFPGQRFKLDDHVKKTKQMRRICPRARAEPKPEPEAKPKKDEAKRKVARDRDADLLSEIFGKR